VLRSQKAEEPNWSCWSHHFGREMLLGRNTRLVVMNLAINEADRQMRSHFSRTVNTSVRANDCSPSHNQSCLTDRVEFSTVTLACGDLQLHIWEIEKKDTQIRRHGVRASPSTIDSRNGRGRPAVISESPWPITLSREAHNSQSERCNVIICEIGDVLPQRSFRTRISVVWISEAAQMR
jgi:hypothetical protein